MLQSGVLSDRVLTEDEDAEKVNGGLNGMVFDGEAIRKWSSGRSEHFDWRGAWSGGDHWGGARRAIDQGRRARERDSPFSGGERVVLGQGFKVRCQVDRGEAWTLCGTASARVLGFRFCLGSVVLGDLQKRPVF